MSNSHVVNQGDVLQNVFESLLAKLLPPFSLSGQHGVEIALANHPCKKNKKKQRGLASGELILTAVACGWFLWKRKRFSWLRTSCEHSELHLVAMVYRLWWASCRLNDPWRRQDRRRRTPWRWWRRLRAGDKTCSIRSPYCNRFPLKRRQLVLLWRRNECINVLNVRMKLTRNQCRIMILSHVWLTLGPPINNFHEGRQRDEEGSIEEGAISQMRRGIARSPETRETTPIMPVRLILFCLF